uniref:Ubiquinol-cytochrome c reductase complex assembly factor 1 n=1 Tax=Sarcophilus harrisii TaxID=9305 RepID=A0A7N4PC02_SARHA
MALLWRVLKVQSGVTQWVTACSQLTPLLLSQRQWLQTSSGIFQWSQKRLSQVDGGSEQVTGVCPWPNRTYHTTVQLLKSKDSSKPIEEKVGALTKIIEAMGFTGPLKYSRWVNSYILKKNMLIMTNSFYAGILGYDEGILSDDHGLAAAIWRTFFNQKCEDPRQLELLVEYVRKQMQYLDSMNGEELLLTGEVTWRPLVEKNPQSVLKPNFPTYNDEGL